MPAVDTGEAATRGFSGAGFDVGAAATSGAGFDVAAAATTGGGGEEGAAGSSRGRGRTTGTTEGFDTTFAGNATGTGTEITAGIARAGGAACTGCAIGTAVHAVSGEGAPAMSGATGEAVGVATNIACALDRWPEDRTAQRVIETARAHWLESYCSKGRGRGFETLLNLRREGEVRFARAHYAYAVVRGRGPCLARSP